MRKKKATNKAKKPRERSRYTRKNVKKCKISSKTVFAIAAHPDDIEFMMAGTLSLLRKKGFDVHYMNIANGCYGSK